ncbi:MAG: hypothetical protein C4519_04975 [Desulfobacteraceae bacterium]|nr:MAG: hypothetical protein C4519_04975 [Desulfobacteraceae bacterium]
MKAFTFRKLDAFTTGASAGNPAGCILLDSCDAMRDADMLRIAYELGGFVSEVGYVRQTPGKEWDYELRYFSREREVNFCGHATVAIMHDPCFFWNGPSSRPKQFSRNTKQAVR